MWASLKAFHLPISQLLPSLKNEYANSKAVGYVVFWDTAAAIIQLRDTKIGVLCVRVNVTLACVCT